jgi:hypothetical protein
MPPPAPSVRHRTGYHHLSDEDDEFPEAEETVLETPRDESHSRSRHDQQEAERGGWSDLIWSFALAAAVTVSATVSTLNVETLTLLFSLWPIFFRDFSTYRCSVLTSPKSGSGTSPQVYPTLDKASLWASQQP